jgi:hypothetical protein
MLANELPGRLHGTRRPLQIADFKGWASFPATRRITHTPLLVTADAPRSALPTSHHSSSGWNGQGGLDVQSAETRLMELHAALVGLDDLLCNCKAKPTSGNTFIEPSAAL